MYATKHKYIKNGRLETAEIITKRNRKGNPENRVI